MGQPDEQMNPGLQKSEKGRHDERIRHYRAVVREAQISLSQKVECTVQGGSAFGLTLDGQNHSRSTFLAEE